VSIVVAKTTLIKLYVCGEVSMRSKGARLNFYHWCCVKHLPAVLVIKFQWRLQIYCMVLVEPLAIYNCALYNWKLSHHLWDIPLVIILWPWNPDKRSLKVIGTNTYRSATYDFLLTFHSNHRPISYHFRDKWQFPSKICQFFPPPCIYNPDEGVTIAIWYRHMGQQKLEWWDYQMVKKVLR